MQDPRRKRRQNSRNKEKCTKGRRFLNGPAAFSMPAADRRRRKEKMKILIMEDEKLLKPPLPEALVILDVTAPGINSRQVAETK